MGNTMQYRGSTRRGKISFLTKPNNTKGMHPMQPHKYWSLEPFVRRTVYLPPSMMDQVRTLAQKAEVPVSEILRRAIDHALDHRDVLPSDSHESPTASAFVYLPRALDARLTLAARTMGHSKTAMMRRLVLFYIEREAWRHGQRD
ncbi:MAG: hypothetical protein C7B46_21075 [Sulfobacillus benefaciens]|uniref:Ribbon-helix-helix protein CopG domain-containing protein n=1 Tax=Sulfobacillus benefaciens TaxID=453960 RepID=A0A2T2WQA8_9FIRM|nr:MAG: hypothetical protein C7B46_21075 [Sulfobacillus benefaciens]